MNVAALMFASFAHPLIVVDGADFDGANDYMTRGAALTGITDSKKGIVSFWFRVDGGDGTERRVFSSQSATPALREVSPEAPTVAGSVDARVRLLDAEIARIERSRPTRGRSPSPPLGSKR